MGKTALALVGLASLFLVGCGGAKITTTTHLDGDGKPTKIVEEVDGWTDEMEYMKRAAQHSKYEKERVEIQVEELAEPVSPLDVGGDGAAAIITYERSKAMGKLAPTKFQVEAPTSMGDVAKEIAPDVGKTIVGTVGIVKGADFLSTLATSKGDSMVVEDSQGVGISKSQEEKHNTSLANGEGTALSASDDPENGSIDPNVQTSEDTEIRETE